MSEMSSISNTCGSTLGMVIMSDLDAETQQVDGIGGIMEEGLGN